MSQETCLLLKSRGFQVDRAKNYQKKNCAFWFGFAQMRKLKEKENKSSKTPVETLRKTDQSTEKNHKDMRNSNGCCICCGYSMALKIWPVKGHLVFPWILQAILKSLGKILQATFLLKIFKKSSKNN